VADDEVSLAAKVRVVHEALASVPHAFGGAIALGFYGEPRATKDIDVNVFVDLDQRAHVLAELGGRGIVVTENQRGRAERDGWEQLQLGRTPVDVFYAYDAFHDAMASAVQHHPFPGGEELPFLSAEHLLACKAIFNRAKDWLDIEQVLFAMEEFDDAEASRWVEHAVGPDDQRLARFRDAVRRLRYD